MLCQLQLFLFLTDNNPPLEDSDSICLSQLFFRLNINLPIKETFPGLCFSDNLFQVIAILCENLNSSSNLRRQVFCQLTSHTFPPTTPIPYCSSAHCCGTAYFHPRGVYVCGSTSIDWAQVQRTVTESMRMNFRINGPRSVEVVDGAVRESSFRFLSMQQPPHKVLFTVAIHLVKAHSMPRWS